MVTESPRTVRWTVRSFTVVIVVSLIAGIAAAIVGGSLTDLGSGYGGLFGIPSILAAAIALFLAMPAALALTRKPERSRKRLQTVIVWAAGAWIVAIGYDVAGHAIDPCVNGWWDSRSRIGEQPLCERFGSELNWHTRFHLLAHAAPAAILLGAYVWVINRLARPE